MADPLPVFPGDVVAAYLVLRDFKNAIEVRRVLGTVRSVVEKGEIIFPMTGASITAKRNDPAVLLQQLEEEAEESGELVNQDAWILTYQSQLRPHNEAPDV